MRRRIPVWMVAAIVAAVGVGGTVAIAASSGGGRVAVAEDRPWEEILAEAEGATVQLWMWGGEEPLNAYIDDVVTPAAAELGVTLRRVPIDDTATAIERLVAEAEAGTRRGAVDLLWVNGQNFAQGAEAALWLRDWVRLLPNAALLDEDDPTLWNDFGVPTEGQEVPWSRAAFVFAHDTERVPDPPRSFEELLDYARANPGRITYPAPPDFTGSAFVRQAVQALGEDAAMDLLVELDPLLWREGRTYPKDQPELDQLLADGQVDVAMSYNPNFVDVAVRRGVFPDTVRPYVFETGTLQNVSFLAIPATAPSPAAAKVVADLLLSPEMQTAKADLVGIPSVLAPELPPTTGSGRSPHRLVDFGEPLAELPVGRVPEIDRRWLQEVAR